MESESPILDESAIVGSTGGLKNALVWIDGIGPAATTSANPVLDQVHCTYVPHVLGVTVGQELVVRSSDATFHNVHLTSGQGDLQNIAMTRSGDEKRVTFREAGVVHVKCDVHPWMTAYVGVFENPFFAVTGDDGSFEIKGLPAGSYKLAIWHEQYGRQEQPITVADDKPAEVTVTYGR